MGTYLIGDIQGCLQPLQRLLDCINFDPAVDKLWCCGDLVNRGGQSLEVLRLLHGVNASVSVTLGNHDLHLLAEDSKYPAGGSKNAEFDEILLAADRQALIGWLSGQPLAVFSGEHRLLRVHAGVIPAWDWQTTLARSDEISSVLNSKKRAKFLKKMVGSRPSKWGDNRSGWRRQRLISNILTRLRFCKANGRARFTLTGEPGSQPRSYQPWFKHKHRRTRDVKVAFGHWAALGLRIRKRYLALDSACVWGGQLSAYRLEDGRLFQVPGKE